MQYAFRRLHPWHMFLFGSYDILGQAAVNDSRLILVRTLTHSLTCLTHAFITLSFSWHITSKLNARWNLYMKWTLLIWIRDYERVKMVNGLRLMAVHWPIIGINAYSVMLSVRIPRTSPLVFYTLYSKCASTAFPMLITFFCKPRWSCCQSQSFVPVLFKWPICFRFTDSSGSEYIFRASISIRAINQEMLLGGWCDKIDLTNHQNMNRCLNIGACFIK